MALTSPDWWLRRSGIIKKLASCDIDVKKRWYEQLRIFDFEKTLSLEHQEIISTCIFSFLVSQILFDKHNLVSTYFYDKLLKREDSISECFIRVFLLSSCYIYYLACREDIKYLNDISTDLRSRCQTIVNQSKNKFKTILKSIAYRDSNLNHIAPFNTINIFNNRLFSFMRNTLGLHELFETEEAKTSIMNDVVDEFISHIVIYIKSESPILNISVDNIMDAKQAEHLFLMFKTNSYIKSSRKSFLKIFNSKSFGKSYIQFIEELQNLYKQNLIKKNVKSAKEDYQVIGTKISRHISEVFGDHPNINCNNYEKTNLLSNLEIPNIYKLNDFSNSIIAFILENILIVLYHRLNKNEANHFFRSQLTDEKLLELIEKHRGHIYIGSDVPLSPNDFCLHFERYKKAESNLSAKHSAADCLGVFIDLAKVKIFVKSISISKVPQTIQNCGATKVNGLFKFAPTGVEMFFTEKELEKYLASSDGVVTISADIGYIIEPETKVDFIYQDIDPLVNINQSY